ncbi:MAG: hypothetical protein JO005_11620 [Gammaproteobacteria bacterium]|nr:hypothetical protein [Gammaproteobacteria bacterium]
METFFRGEAVMAQRSVVLEQLERAERHIKQGEARLARQRSLLADGAGGAQTQHRTLRQLEEAQSAYRADLERLRAEFAALDDTEGWLGL